MMQPDDNTPPAVSATAGIIDCRWGITAVSTAGGGHDAGGSVQPGTRAGAGALGYSLDPRQIKLKRVLTLLLLILAPLIFFWNFSFKALWEFGWRYPLYSLTQLTDQTSATGQRFAGGDWVRTKTIRVYGAPGVPVHRVQAAADGLRSLVRELDLQIRVIETTPDARALASLHAATPGPTFDFETFLARRLDDRGMEYGEMVVVQTQFLEPGWAFGLSEFAPGLAVLRARNTDASLGRHEGAHLLGYDRHDDHPYYVFGYGEEKTLPDERDTLMMLRVTASDALSPRARAALHAFWQGLEDRQGQRFFAE